MTIIETLHDLYVHLSRIERLWNNEYTFSYTWLSSGNGAGEIELVIEDKKYCGYPMRILCIRSEGNRIFTLEDKSCEKYKSTFTFVNTFNKVINYIYRYGMCGIKRELEMICTIGDKLIPLFKTCIDNELYVEIVEADKPEFGMVPALYLTLKDSSVLGNEEVKRPDYKCENIAILVEFDTVDGVRVPYYRVMYCASELNVCELYSKRVYYDEQSLIQGIIEVAKWDFLKMFDNGV